MSMAGVGLPCPLNLASSRAALSAPCCLGCMLMACIRYLKLLCPEEGFALAKGT